MIDGNVHTRGTDIVLQVPQDNANPIGKGLISWVDYIELNYNMILLLQHILYLCCIHDDIVK
jgi:hypothetical protein